MARISIALAVVVALGAPLLFLEPRLAHAGGALDTVTAGAGALFGTAPAADLGAAGALSTPPLTWAPLEVPPRAEPTLAAVVVAAPLESDDPAPRGDELALRIAARVAARIGAGARAHPLTAQLATARAVAGRANALVYVRSAIVKGDLRATLDVYPSMVNSWDRIRNPVPLPTNHTAARAKVDAEVRSFLPALALEQATVERARHDEGEVLAAACGDADGDGDNALVLVSAARVALGHVRAGRFVAERTATWSALGPTLPVPMRDPIAEAVVGAGAVGVGTTDHGGLRLTPALTVDAPLVGLPVWGGDDLVCLRPEASAGAFDGAPVECSLRGEPRPRLAVPAPRFDAFGAALIADALGNARTVVAVREPSGRLRLKAGDALGVAEGTFGAQLAVGDLDQDGAAEIATSADLPVAGAQTARLDDAIDIATWSPGPPGSAAPAGPPGSASSPASPGPPGSRAAPGPPGSAAPPGPPGSAGPPGPPGSVSTGPPGSATTPTAPASPLGPDLRSRFHLAAPGGVRALAMCPPGEHGEPSLVAVVGGEIWTVRAGVMVAPSAAAPKVAR
jgi:hypothetical protein